MTLLVAMLLSQACASPFVCRTGTQDVDGFLYFNAGAAAMDDLYVNTSIRGYPGRSVVLFGDRNDVDGPAVVVGNSTRRDAGNAFEVRRGPDTSDRILVVDSRTGNVIIACEEGSNTRTCTWVDGSGVSGHWSATTMPRYYYVIASRLSENHLNTFADGGCNMFEVDGGCYASFTARHGGLTIVESEARPFGGWGFEYVNPVTDGTGPSRFHVGAWGQMGQRHFMIRAQFPKCPADVELTTPQTQNYVQGVEESELLYAFDEHEWYFCDGSDWQPMRPGESMLASSTGRSVGIAALAIAVLALLGRRKPSP